MRRTCACVRVTRRECASRTCMRAEANCSAENEEVGRVNKSKRDRAGSYEMERQRGGNAARKETK